MKAMVLAAGLGTRMRPLTLTQPKPLLEVGGKALIVWHLEKLKASGIDQVVINTAWLAECLVEALGDGRQYGINILWSHEAEGLETAGGIINALPLLGDEPFLVINGDVWTRFDFASLVTHQLGEDLAHLVLVDNPAQHPDGDFGLQQGRIIADRTIGGDFLTFSGLSILSPQLFKDLPPGKRPLAPLLREAMQQQRVSGEKMQTAWVDVGTPERLTELNQQIQHGLI